MIARAVPEEPPWSVSPFRRAAADPSRPRSLSLYLRQLWDRRWRPRRGDCPPPLPPEDAEPGDPWDDPALWLLMIH